jgi:hypothetical protein
VRRPGGLLVPLLLALGVAAAVAPAAAQVELTVVPAMTRGPEGARITIVEFLDYE